MTTYYAGMTVYLEDTPRTRERLSVLSQRMEPLQSIVPEFGEDLIGQMTVLDGHECTHLAENHHMFEGDASQYPDNTPSWRQRVSLNEVQLDGRDGVRGGLRLHIPVTHEDVLEVNHMIHGCLYKLFTEMFESDLSGIVIKKGTNRDDLDALRAVPGLLPAYCHA